MLIIAVQRKMPFLKYFENGNKWAYQLSEHI